MLDRLGLLACVLWWLLLEAATWPFRSRVGDHAD